MADDVLFGQTGDRPAQENGPAGEHDAARDGRRLHLDGADSVPDVAQGAEIVALAERARETRYPMLAHVEAYWQELRGNRVVPARSEVDPRRIEDALEYAFILERIAPGMARFRLAGMHLNDLMGMEVRGMPLTAFFDPEARKSVSAALERVFSEPAMASLTLTGERGIGRPTLEGRLLMLPLKSDLGEVSRVLGCLATLGPIGRTPRRFHVAADRIRPLLGTDTRRSDRPAPPAWEMPGPVLPRRPRRDPAPVEPVATPTPRPALRGIAPGDGAQGVPAAGASRPPRTEGRPQLRLIRGDLD